MDGAELAIKGGPPVRTDPWPERASRFGEEELRQLKEALDQNTLFYAYGAKTRRLCELMTQMCGAAHAVACSSGSAALHAAVKACGVGPGDEVITSPITDAGTILGIVYEGALPVFADVDPATYNITAESIGERLTPRTRAVIVVHLAGVPAEMGPIVALCRGRGISVIEDCAQSWCARLGERWVGTFGEIGCFSLNDFKHITCGDGGLIVTDQEELYRRAWLCTDKCYDRIDGGRELPFVAPNYRISELQSAVAIAQLGRVERITSARHRLGTLLTAALEGIRGLRPHGAPRGAYCTWWFYLVGVNPGELGVPAQQFAEAVAAEGVPLHAGYVEPVYLAYRYLREQSAFNHSRWPFTLAPEEPRFEPGLCPRAEDAMRNCVFVPLNEDWTERELNDAVEAMRKVAAAHAPQEP